MKSVYSAVRTGSLNTAVCASSLKGLSNQYERETDKTANEIYKKEKKEK